jgi:hypothetical protein
MSRTCHVLLIVAAASVAAPFLTSCATDESNTQLRRRLDERNESYRERQERRAIRAQAREERYNIWWDRVMGR